MSTPHKIQTEAIRVTWIGAVIDTLLGISKIITGLLTHSSALVADGIHSLSDLATDALVVVMLRLSHQPPDKEHPWGHGRIETLGTVLLGCILIAVAGGMAWNSTLALLSDLPPLIPSWPGLVVALISIAAKEGIYRYTLAVGQRIKSDLLIANAWHSRTDALSSVVVFIGIGGSMVGLVWMDTLAAVLVAAMVAHIGWGLSWRSIQQLIDTAPPGEELSAIAHTAAGVEGVKAVHDMKVRYIGSEQALELHILIEPLYSASEGHFIAEQVGKHLRQLNPQLQQLIIHVDTRNDQNEPDPPYRPSRSELEPLLHNWLNQQQLALLRLDLHYRRDTVALELSLGWTDRPQRPPHELIERLREHLQHPVWLERIRISYGVDE